MFALKTKKTLSTRGRRIVGFLAAGVLVCNSLTGVSHSQEVRCNPDKVMTANECAKCHLNEVKVWKQTPHFQTFEQLSRNPEAKAICSKLGLRSVKRSDTCIKCHFTMKNNDGKLKAISGVSCESCHGASKDWIQVHNDYGPTGNKDSETPAHAQQRLETATSMGMRNTRNLYAIASSCLNCHTVPDEKLVNVGGHKAGTDEFELVAYSQGRVRHNFLRTSGTLNAPSSPERLRVMYVIGLIADLEYSTRATAAATEKSTFGLKVANRAARTAVKLYELSKQISDPNVQTVLQTFASAELKTNNQSELLSVADQIRAAGEKFAREADGKRLSAVDSLLPSPETYK